MNQVTGYVLQAEPTNVKIEHDMGYVSSHDPVVVYMPVGNYNDLKEFGRFKNIGVAMAIISSFNNPDDFGGTPEYHIFSLETGAKIQLH